MKIKDIHLNRVSIPKMIKEMVSKTVTNNTTGNKSDKEKLEAVIQLLKPRDRKHYNRASHWVMQEVVFEVSDNGELSYIISCLLRLCILSLDSESDFASSRLLYCSKELTIATVLELADSLLPDAQLESYDAIEKLLLQNKE